MRLQNNGLFYQSEQYVSFLCEPLNILQFLDNQANQSMNQSTELDYLEILNKSKKQENSHKIYSEQSNQIKPIWMLVGQLSSVKAIWTLFIQHNTKKKAQMDNKKVKTDRTQIGKKQLIFYFDQCIQNAQYIQDIKFQEKLNRQTASKSNNRRVNKLNKDYQQSFSGQRQSFSGQRQSFSGQQQPLTSFEQYNL